MGELTDCQLPIHIVDLGFPDSQGEAMFTILIIQDESLPEVPTCLGREAAVHVLDSECAAVQRLQMHPVDILVIPAKSENPFAEPLATLIEEQNIESIHYGTAQELAQIESDQLILTEQVMDRLPEMIESIMEQRRAGQLRERLNRAVASRTVTLDLGNQKSLISATVQFLLDECEEMGATDCEDRMKVGIALEEALVNSIVHGNLEVSSELRERDDDAFERTILERQRTIQYMTRNCRIICTMSRDGAEFDILDEGPGFDVSSVPDPRDPEYMERASGRGILLMQSFMDEVKYNQTGNRVLLRKFRAGPMAEEVCESAECETVGAS